MNAGSSDIPLAHWGVLYIDSGCGAPMALIPCDFLVVGWSSVVGLSFVLPLLPQSHFIHTLPIFHFHNRGFQSTSSGGYYRGRFPAASFMMLK